MMDRILCIMDHLHKMFFAVVSCHAGSMTQILFINDRIFIATHICGWLRAVTKTRCSHPQSCDCGSECHHNEMTQVGQGEQCYELWALKLPTPAPSPHPAPRRVKLQLDNNRTLVHLTLPAIAAFTSRLSKTCILSSFYWLMMTFVFLFTVNFYITHNCAMQFTEDTGVTGFSPEIENKFDELEMKICTNDGQI